MTDKNSDFEDQEANELLDEILITSSSTRRPKRTATPADDSDDFFANLARNPAGKTSKNNRRQRGAKGGRR